jgi:hypothetical protein
MKKIAVSIRKALAFPTNGRIPYFFAHFHFLFVTVLLGCSSCRYRMGQIKPTADKQFADVSCNKYRLSAGPYSVRGDKNHSFPQTVGL